VTQTQHHIVGISLTDGKLLWDIPFTTEYEQNIVTPVVFNDLLIYSGLNKPTTAVRITHAAGRWGVEKVWENADVPMYMNSPVETGGHLFGLTHRNRGQFFCLDAATGKTRWTTRGREGENAALVVAGNVLMATTTEGQLVVMRPNPDAPDTIRRYTVAESPIWTHPAPAGSGVIIKDENALAYWTF
jgi:outer membrane protein assembly factor BamB